MSSDMVNDYTPDICQTCKTGKKIKELEAQVVKFEALWESAVLREDALCLNFTRLEAENARLKEHLGVVSVIPWLAEAAQILLDEHDYDGDCWESITSAAIIGRNWVDKHMPERLERIPQIKSKIHGEQAPALPSRVKKLEGLLRRILEDQSLYGLPQHLCAEIRAALEEKESKEKGK